MKQLFIYLLICSTVHGQSDTAKKVPNQLSFLIGGGIDSGRSYGDTKGNHVVFWEKTGKIEIQGDTIECMRLMQKSIDQSVKEKCNYGMLWVVICDS